MTELTLPFLTGHKGTDLENYVRFRCVRAYLSQRAEATFPDKGGKLTPRLVELVDACGYSRRKVEKFRTHRKGWHQLSRWIPHRYLQAIGAERAVLEFCLEQDQKEFDAVAHTPVCPEGFTVRMMSCVYPFFPLPPGTTEEAAIEAARYYTREKGRVCWIKLNQVRTIWLHPSRKPLPDGTHEVHISQNFNRPAMVWKKEGVLFSTDNTDLGTVTIR